MERIVDIPDTVNTMEIGLDDSQSLKMLTGWPVREEILRCRDCKWFENIGERNGVPLTICNNFYIGIWSEKDNENVMFRAAVGPDDFCSRGERREMGERCSE